MVGWKTTTTKTLPWRPPRPSYLVVVVVVVALRRLLRDSPMDWSELYYYILLYGHGRRFRITALEGGNNRKDTD
jgi:hypothetical protein